MKPPPTPRAGAGRRLWRADPPLVRLLDAAIGLLVLVASLTMILVVLCGLLRR